MIFLSTANNLANSTAVREAKKRFKSICRDRSCKLPPSLTKYETCAPIGVSASHDGAFCPKSQRRRWDQFGAHTEGFTCQMLVSRECGSTTTHCEDSHAADDTRVMVRDTPVEEARDLRRESLARKWRRLHSRGRQSVSKAAEASVMISFSPPVTKWHLFTCSCGMGRQCGMCVD